MNKNTKILVACLMAAGLTFSSALAANLDDYTINETEKSITLVGTPEGVRKNQPITLQMLKPDKSITDYAVRDDGGAIIGYSISPQNIKNDFLLYTQVPANASGGYSVTVEMKNYLGEDEAAGFYTLRVNGKDELVFYALSDTKITEFGKIKTIIQKEKTDAVISELESYLDLKNKYSLPVNLFKLTEQIIFDVDSTKLSNGVYECLKAEISTLNENNVAEYIKKAAYLTAIDEGVAKTADFDDLLGAEQKYITAFGELSTELSASFDAAYIKGKNYLTLTKFKDEYKKAVVLSMIDDMGAWGDVEDYITDFGDEVIDGEALVNTSDYAKLAGDQQSELYDAVLLYEGDFDSIDSFRTFVNGKIDKLLNPTTSIEPELPEGSNDGSVSGSGSVGGGGGGGGGGTKPNDKKDPEETKEPDEEIKEPVTELDNPGAVNDKPFDDTVGFEWAEEAITKLSELGVVNGTGDGKFEPERDVAREEVLVMILRAFEVEAEATDTGFSDAKSDDWYAPYLAAAKTLGFVSGKPDGTFGIGEAVTREDAAVMAYNIAKASGYSFVSGETESFADDSEISYYAREAVYALKKCEVLNGKGDGLFAPKASCTRAETAKIIYTLLKLVKGE